MDKFEFDKTRKNLRLDKLSERDRSRMLNRFVRAGGEIIKESLVEEETQAQERRRLRAEQLKESFAQSPKESRKQQQEQGPVVASAGERLDAENAQATSFPARFTLRLRAKFAGVANFFGQKVKPDFLSELNTSLRSDCGVLRNFAIQIAAENKHTGGRVFQFLQDKKPIYVQLIQKSVEIYRKEDAATLMSGGIMGSEIYFLSIREPVFQVLNRLHYLKPYQKTYIDALKLFIQLFQNYSAKSYPQFHANMLAKVSQSWDNLLNHTYPRIALLALRMEMKNTSPDSLLFSHLLKSHEKTL